MEQLAAREVRRYVYLRTGVLLPMVTEAKAARSKRNLILVGRKDRPLIRAGREGQVLGALDALAPQSYWLKTVPNQRASTNAQVLLVTGGDDAGTLYAAYRLAEKLGVRFYLHGDVIPDERAGWKLPVLDERAAPLFALRGIQPFHDFPEGPDWWNRDDYLAIIGQLPKLRHELLRAAHLPRGAPERRADGLDRAAGRTSGSPARSSSATRRAT